jgi:hypothetical protein
VLIETAAALMNQQHDFIHVATSSPSSSASAQQQQLTSQCINSKQH